MKLLLAIIAFNLIVIIHEYGHFLMAKRMGIKVYEFSLFMGPKIFSFKHNETTYSLRAIPMLAYVSFAKEDSLYEDRALNNEPIHARAAVMAGGPLFNIIAGAIAFAIMYAITGYTTTAISTVPIDTPAYYSGVQAGDIVTKLNDKRIYQPMEVDMFLSVIPTKNTTVDIEVLRGKETIPIKLTPQIIPENRRLIGFVPKQTADGEPTNTIGSLESGGPAEKAGLKVGDTIIGMDNQQISTMQQILNFMYKNKGEAVKVTVSRGGKVLPPLEIKPKQGSNPESFYTGLRFTSAHGNIIDILKYAAINTYSYVRIGGYSIAWLIQGKVPVNQMTGAVGAVDMINSVVQQSTSAKEVVIILLFMSGLISIALGVTNLLPIPPADGSKLLLLLVEFIRRKPLAQEKEAFIMMVGFGIMILLFIFTLYNDIARILVRVFGG